MREYGKIKTSIWTNPTVRLLSDDGRMLYLYILACPHGNSLGVFVLPPGYICEDIGWPLERVAKHVSELVSQQVIERDEATRLTRIVSWWEDNTIENENVAKAAVKTLKLLPKCDVLYKSILAAIGTGNRFINKFRNELENELPNEYRNIEPEPEPEPKPEPDGFANAPDPLALEVDFQQFVCRFPSRANIADARQQFAEALQKTNLETLLAKASEYAAAVVGSEPNFIQAPARWLRNERWRETFAAVAKTPPKPSRNLQA